MPAHPHPHPRVQYQTANSTNEAFVCTISHSRQHCKSLPFSLRRQSTCGLVWPFCRPDEMGALRPQRRGFALSSFQCGNFCTVHCNFSASDAKVIPAKVILAKVTLAKFSRPAARDYSGSFACVFDDFHGDVVICLADSKQSKVLVLPQKGTPGDIIMHGKSSSF